MDDVRERRTAENDLSARQIAATKNEVSAREVNETIEDASGGVQAVSAFVCECSRADCRLLVKLSSPEYEAIRADPRRFVVVPGHLDEEIEIVVEARPGHLVVEKHGGAGQLAEAHDPRA